MGSLKTETIHRTTGVDKERLESVEWTSALRYTNAEMPVMRSPMISLWMSLVPS
jgi:hypothetical protein